MPAAGHHNLPFVSIVIPSLNRAQYLSQTIDSILKQDYPNIECIVIDGGSTDGTIDVLHRYDGRLKWVMEPDSSRADAVNKGWGMSKGQILAWLNVDDCYALPDAVGKAVEALTSDPGADMVYGNYATLAEDGSLTSGILKPCVWNLEYAVKHCFHTIIQPASFIRRSILERAGWLDVSLENNHDHDLWLKIGRIGNIKYVPIFFAYIRDCSGMTQDRSMAKSIVKMEENFFAGSNLPASLKSKSFKRRAMSNAYLVGSNFALLGPYYKEFIFYLFKSISTDPLNFPRIIAKTGRTVFSVIFPKKLKTMIKKTMAKGKIAS